MLITLLKKYMPIFICALVWMSDVQAQISNEGVLDNVLERYAEAATAWSDIITQHATWLFWTLATISLAWTFGMMALSKAAIEEFIAETTRFILFTGFYFWLLTQGPQFAVFILESMQQIGSEAVGLTTSLSPSNIVDIGYDIFVKVIDGLSVWSPVESTVGAIIGIAILIILTLIGVNMLLLLVSSWILAYAGIIFLGFGGCKWTSDMAINYFKTVLGVGTQLFTMILLVGIGTTFLDDYYLSMNAGLSLKDMAVLMIVALVLLALVNKVPTLLSGIITGASVGGGGIGSFGMGAFMGAAGMAAATVASGGAAAVGGLASMAGGAQALTAAISKAGETLSGNSSGGESSGLGGSSQSGSSENSTSPLAAAMGNNQTGGFASSAASKVSSSARFVREVGKHLGKGMADVAAGKFNSIKEAGQERISHTVGGKIAESIKNSSQSHFGENSISGTTSDSKKS